ncbi:unnamed protein product [Heligmosomoides polygyrus]|uniref:Uncharacterized protein n=1 Tax=Heligmosomoides polygyrus TaxID=6339 RepID=A0A183G300_HELPZ|nr:unnamed protein product [Heligmosomoides polygyrus]
MLSSAAPLLATVVFAFCLLDIVHSQYYGGGAGGGYYNQYYNQYRYGYSQPTYQYSQQPAYYQRSPYGYNQYPGYSQGYNNNNNNNYYSNGYNGYNAARPSIFQSMFRGASIDQYGNSYLGTPQMGFFLTCNGRGCAARG